MRIKEPLVSSSLRWYRSRWANRHLRCADGISLCLCSLGYISTSILTYRYGKYDGSWDEGKIRIKRNCVSNTSKICRRHPSRWKAMQATGRYHKNRVSVSKYVRGRNHRRVIIHPDEVANNFLWIITEVHFYQNRRKHIPENKWILFIGKWPTWYTNFFSMFYSHQLMHFFIQLCISLLSYIKIT